jgi:type IV secretory pathway VirB2 component (pilin)
MTTPNTIQRMTHARTLLAAASWTMLALVIAGYLTTVPMADRWLTSLEQTTTGRVGEALVIFIAGVAALAVWAGALWHVLSTPRERSVKWTILIVLLVAGNFVAGFFYYFLHVLWHPQSREAERAIRSSTPS